MADLAKIVDELSNLTVLEAAELSKMLEEKWGVSAAAPVAVAAVAGGAGAAAADFCSTSFSNVWTRFSSVLTVSVTRACWSWSPRLSARACSS